MTRPETTSNNDIQRNTSGAKEVCHWLMTVEQISSLVLKLSTSAPGLSCDPGYKVRGC